MEHKEQLKDKTDKEVGLGLKELPEDVRGMIFVARKVEGNLLDDAKACNRLYRDVRPTLNALEGYEPSYALSRSIGSGD